MPRLSDAQIAEAARKAGFTGPGLVTAIAVALAESGGNSDAMGDVGLVDGKWGPSVGLWQIRSLHDQRGTGGPRDEFANVDPDANARAAFAISGGGVNFAPWSVYKNGRYQANIARAQAAAGRTSSDLGWVETVTEAGSKLSPFPWFIGSKAGEEAREELGAIRGYVIGGLIAAGGVALVVAGMWKGTR